MDDKTLLTILEIGVIVIIAMSTISSFLRNKLTEEDKKQYNKIFKRRWIIWLTIAVFIPVWIMIVNNAMLWIWKEELIKTEEIMKLTPIFWPIIITYYVILTVSEFIYLKKVLKKQNKKTGDINNISH